MNWSYWFGSVLGLGALGYFGYKYSREKMNDYIMGKVMRELDKRLENEEGFTPMKKTSSAMIKINHGGKSHSIYVPYNRRKSTKMLQTRVFLLKGEEKIPISQKPGIPYLVSAKDLGGDIILIEDRDGNVLKVYKDDEVPDFYK